MSTIAAGTTSGTALVNTGDTTGNLVFQTNGTTTALTLNTSQNATFAGNVTVTGSISAGSGIPSLATPLAVTGNATAGAELRLPEDTDNGSNYVAVKSPDALAANYTCTLPDETCTLGFRNIPQNEQTGSYTLVLTDSAKHVYRGSGGAATWTIPANSSVAYPVGTALTFINYSATSVSIAITTDTMRLSSAGTTGTRTLAQYGSATAIKVDSTNWIISGSGLT